MRIWHGTTVMLLLWPAAAGLLQAVVLVWLSLKFPNYSTTQFGHLLKACLYLVSGTNAAAATA